ncbi:MAG: hypothetical protein CMJ84_12530 [Planctomycetes bacterium]|jgi:uncharacterized RDD family membrane protein YckC|nr:hypothetical protein [Planctomycetota bacterium]MDP6409467.1 RDD family protein [Planctomycetota bacterium]
MTSLIVETAEGIQLRRSLAGAGSRLAAGLLDGILVAAGFLSLVLGAVLLAGDGFAILNGIGGFILGLLAGGLVGGLVLYQIVFGLIWDGQTPGKRLMGLCLAAADGHPASALQVVIRSLVWPVDAFFFVPAPLGVILMAATPRSQRLGDLAAGTLVLAEGRGARPAEPPPLAPSGDDGPGALLLSPGLAARLAGEDRALLRDILVRRDLPSTERVGLARAALGHYGERLGVEFGGEPLRALAELYSFAEDARRGDIGAGRAGQSGGASPPPRN